MSDGAARNVRVIAAAALVVAFLCGGLVGALAMRTWGTPRVLGAALSPARDVGLSDALIYDGLDLTAEQKAAIDSVGMRARAQAADVWRDVQPRFRDVVDSARAEIHEILTPEQRDEFERRIARRRRLIERWLGDLPDGRTSDR